MASAALLRPPLARAGFDVQVSEQAKALGEVGAGINIGPNASRILNRLGMAEELAKAGVRPVTFDQRRWDDGGMLLRAPLGDAVQTTFGAPYYTLHRGDLHRILADAVPADRIHLGHRFTRVVDRGDTVEAHFENGASISADVAIGADGIHSAVRHALFGPERPRFTGCVAYRGLVPADRLTQLELERTTQIWMGPGRHFVHYFVSAGRLVNFVAVTEDTTGRRNRGSIAAKSPTLWPRSTVFTIRYARSSARPTRPTTSLFDRSLLPRWSAGRVTLLGDSCHPMLPFMGQGAAQAIEDAATLKGCLLKFPDDVPAALRRYEELRLPRASRLQGMSAVNKTRFHLADGEAQRERDAEMAAGATDWSFAAIAWLYEHDAESQPRSGRC